MKFKMNKQIGAITFQFEDEALSNLDFFKKASFYAQLPTICGHCKSDKIILEYREPKGYKYASLFCLACRHQLSFGAFKEGEGALFAKFSEGWKPIPHDEKALPAKTNPKEPPENDLGERPPMHRDDDIRY